MTDRRWRMVIGGLIGIQLFACCACMYWATRPLKPVPPVQAREDELPTDTTNVTASYSSDHLMELSSLRLRGSLDPPETPPRQQSPSVVRRPPRVDVRLVGTVIEHDRSVAILMDSTGRIQLRAAGDQLEGSTQDIRVQRVDYNQVTLRVDDRELTVLMEQSSR